MKKFLAFLVIMTLLLSLTACGKGEADTTTAGAQQPAGTEADKENETQPVEQTTEEETQAQVSGPVTLPEAGEIVKSGDWSEDVHYTLDTNGILTVSGEGKMLYTEGYERPSIEEIVYLVVEEGVKSVCVMGENDNLLYVSLPSTVKQISERAFYGCRALTTVDLAEGIEKIGKHAFSRCTNLTFIHVPSTVSRLEICAFSVSGLTSIELPEKMNHIDDAFTESKIVSITWPAGLHTIYQGTFYKCPELTSITISKDVTTIQDYAFAECPKLTDVYYEGTEEEFRNIEIGSNNEAFLNANIHYNN